MTEIAPTLYIKEGCPFCFKTLLFLLEAGLMDRVQIRRFAAGSPEEQVIKDELAPHIEKLTFPAARLAPDRHLTESDAIIDHFATQAGVDKQRMPLLAHYVEGPLQSLMKLYKENMELKAKATA